MAKFELKSFTRRGDTSNKRMQTSVNSAPNPTKKQRKPAPFQLHDEYFLKAKKEGYRARSVYKLIEIQEKFDLIKP
jgi:23S rRNA (uridine2552-2'-O)-methyltransferase